MAQPGTPKKKAIEDLEKQFEETPPHDRKIPDRTSTDQCMAKLHALLTKEPSKSLQRAQSRALAQQQYYHRATQFFSQQHEGNVDVFPFFALPAEIRLDIFFELLVTDNRLVITWRGPRKANKQQKRMYISILMVCKLCRDEGTSVLYGENIFDFEEICGRPITVAKPFVNRIGPHNALLIRIVIAEYSAAAEELAQIQDDGPARFTIPFVQNFLSGFNISLSHLRVLAISIVPYGFDQATMDLMIKQALGIMGTMTLHLAWLDNKNEPGRLRKVADGICEREAGLVRANYIKDVDSWIGFHWSPPFLRREWIVYEGVRTREEVSVGMDTEGRSDEMMAMEE